MDEEGEELLEAGWYIRGAGDDPGCTIAHGLEKQDARGPGHHLGLQWRQVAPKSTAALSGSPLTGQR